MSRAPLREVLVDDQERIQWDQFAIEIALGLVSPFMLPVTLANAYHDFYYYGPIYQGDNPPPRRFDSERTRLHGFSWAAAAFGSWGYHAWIHPGKYLGLRTSGDVVKLTLHAISKPHILIPVAYAAPTVIGYQVVSSQADTLSATPGREHESRGLWQTLSAALTGGFGAGSHGLF
jgi:hypothetical protein